MYRMMKTDPWGNEIPMMDLARKKDADEFWKRHRNMTMRMVGAPRCKQSAILQ